MRRRDKGAALIVAMVAIIAIAGMATALINMAAMRSKGVNDRLDQFRAFQAAQSAVARVMTRMADPAIGPTNAGFGDQFISDVRVGDMTLFSGGAGGTKEMLGEAEYFAVVGAVGDGTYKVVAAGRLGDTERVIEILVKPPPPLRLPTPFTSVGETSHGAVGIFGDAKSITFNINSDTTEISGLDLNERHSFGLAGSGSAYALIEAQVESGALDASDFTGPITSTFNLDGGGTATTSIGEVSEARVDGATILEYAAAIQSTVAQLIDDNPDRVDDSNKPGSWGTSADDITILTGTNATTQSDVTGAGTLIVMGKFTINHTFNWTGDIIVLGSGGPASIHNKGDATFNGVVTLIADGGKADFHANGSGNGTTINGAMLLMGGSATGGGGKTSFHINTNGATCDINGMVMAMGDDINFRVNGRVNLNVAGGLVFASAAGSSSVDASVNIMLRGDSVNIQQDSVNIDNAIGEIEDFFDDFAPDVEPPPGTGSYNVIVWREK